MRQESNIKCIMKNHISIDYPELEQINLPDRRLYKVPGGNEYPSVTTVLGATSENDWIDKWKHRVGEEEATRVSKRATMRGTALHSYCEDYLNNKKPDVNMFDIENFNKFKVALNRIDNIYGIEKQLYSHRMQTAGTVDLIAEYDGVLSVIDWKTSNSDKSRESISDYFIQTSFYAACIYEMFNIYIPKLVIVMASDESSEPLIYEEETKTWIPKFVEKRKLFKKLRGY